MARESTAESELAVSGREQDEAVAASVDDPASSEEQQVGHSAIPSASRS